MTHLNSSRTGYFISKFWTGVFLYQLLSYTDLENKNNQLKKIFLLSNQEKRQNMIFSVESGIEYLKTHDEIDDSQLFHQDIERISLAKDYLA